MNKENCALKLVDELILYYDAWSKKHQITCVSGFIDFYSLFIFPDFKGVNILCYILFH